MKELKADVLIILILIAAILSFIFVATIAPYSMTIATIAAIAIGAAAILGVGWMIGVYITEKVREASRKERGELIKTLACTCDDGGVYYDGHALLYEKGMSFADDIMVDPTYTSDLEDGIELVDFEKYSDMQWVFFDSTIVAVKYHTNKVKWFSSQNVLRMKALSEWLISKGVPEKRIDIPEQIDELIN